jgi:glutamate racemase
VLDALLESDRDWRIDYLADNAWLPYGEKPDAALVSRIPMLVAAAADEWASEIVILACNTASTIALDAVRVRVSIPVVGVVPPVKPAAAATRTGRIGLLATPATIARAYTDRLVASYAADVEVVRLGTTRLVEIAEAKLRGCAIDAAEIARTIAPMFYAPHGRDIDVVALACTHFPLLKDDLAHAAPQVRMWMDPSDAVARRAAEVATATQGTARVRRIGLTDSAAFAGLAPALSARGFDALARVSPDLPFVIDSARFVAGA